MPKGKAAPKPRATAATKTKAAPPKPPPEPGDEPCAEHPDCPPGKHGVCGCGYAHLIPPTG